MSCYRLHMICYGIVSEVHKKFIKTANIKNQLQHSPRYGYNSWIQSAKKFCKQICGDTTRISRKIKPHLTQCRKYLVYQVCAALERLCQEQLTLAADNQPNDQQFPHFQSQQHHSLHPSISVVCYSYTAEQHRHRIIRDQTCPVSGSVCSCSGLPSDPLIVYVMLLRCVLMVEVQVWNLYETNASGMRVLSTRRRYWFKPTVDWFHLLLLTNVWNSIRQFANHSLCPSSAISSRIMSHQRLNCWIKSPFTALISTVSASMGNSIADAEVHHTSRECWESRYAVLVCSN